jgi:hypothetical protein
MKTRFLLLLTLLSLSTYSQVIKKVDGEKVVVFTLEQAKGVNDTFVSQRAEIERLKNLKPIVRVDTVQVVQIVEKKTEQLFTIEGLVFMVVQGIIMFPLIFMK